MGKPSDVPHSCASQDARYPLLAGKLKKLDMEWWDSPPQRGLDRRDPEPEAGHVQAVRRLDMQHASNAAGSAPGPETGHDMQQPANMERGVPGPVIGHTQLATEW